MSLAFSKPFPGKFRNNFSINQNNIAERSVILEQRFGNFWLTEKYRSGNCSESVLNSGNGKWIISVCKPYLGILVETLTRNQLFLKNNKDLFTKYHAGPFHPDKKILPHAGKHI